MRKIMYRIRTIGRCENPKASSNPGQAMHLKKMVLFVFFQKYGRVITPLALPPGSDGSMYCLSTQYVFNNQCSAVGAGVFRSFDPISTRDVPTTLLLAPHADF